MSGLFLRPVSHFERPILPKSEHALMVDALLLFLAMPDHAGKTLQRHQRFARIGPLLHLLDGDVIERLPAGTAREQRARDVHHMRRTRALIEQRRAASRAKAAHGFAGLVLEAGDGGAAPGDSETLAPAPDIGRVGGAVRAPTRRRMIVPGPSGGRVDFKADSAAQALTCGYPGCLCVFCHSRFQSPSSCEEPTGRNDVGPSSPLQVVMNGIIGIAGRLAALEGRAS